MKRVLYPDEWRERYLEARSCDQLTRDLAKAFDRIRFLKLQVWVLMLLLGAKTGVETGLADVALRWLTKTVWLHLIR